MQGGINLYAYAWQDPINAFDPNGLECKLINSFFHTDTNTVKSDPIWGDWVFQKYTQVNIRCMCSWKRDSIIKVDTTFKKYRTDVYKCTNEESCTEYTTSKTTEVDSASASDTEAGPSELKRKWGTMFGTSGGANVESGGGCDCAPKTRRPPGIYN